jgi:DNA-binding MurR/RpiR family transcriptional regulator
MTTGSRVLGEEAVSQVFAQIRSLYPSLTKAERKVADVVLGDDKTFVYGSISDLADKAGVGETSVLRFCRDVGYRGFQEFKLVLVQESARTEVRGSEGGREAPLSLNLEVAQRNTRLIEETSALIDEEALERSVQHLRSAGQIVFFGVGSSGLTAEDARQRFLRVGLPVEAVGDSHLALVRVSLLGKGDVAVIISVTGSTVDTVEVAKIAKKNGAIVVCVTNQANSPLTKLADVVLLGAIRWDPTGGSSLATKIVQLHVLELLFEATLRSMGEEGRELLRKTAETASRKLY